VIFRQSRRNQAWLPGTSSLAAPTTRRSWLARSGRSGCGGLRCRHDKEADMLLLSSNSNDDDEVDNGGLLTDQPHIG
jgi:hypothetical protein